MMNGPHAGGPLSFSRRVGGAITRFKVTVVMSSKSLRSHVLFSSLVTGLSLGDLGYFEIHVFPPSFEDPADVILRPGQLRKRHSVNDGCIELGR